MAALGLSVQKVWGLVRAIQLIAASAMVTVKRPAALHVFLSVALVFSQLDMLDMESTYAARLDLLPTTAVSDSFGFYGLDNRNFLLNSGSYFAVQLGAACWCLLRWVLNAVAARNSENYYWRRLGMWAWSPAFSAELWHATHKLLLESSFDLALCCCLELSAFFDADDFGGFWIGRDNAICSTLAIAYTILMLAFLYSGWSFLSENRGNLDQPDNRGTLSVFTSGVRLDDYHASNAHVYFLARRLATAPVLVFLHRYPYFQCTFLLGASTLNFVYLATVRPMVDGLENAVELFNEGCILACAYMWFVLCDQARSDEEATLIAWTFMASAGANVFGNLVLASCSSGGAWVGKLLKAKREREARRYLEERRQNRKVITEQLPGAFPRFEAEVSLMEAIEQARVWAGQATWLLRNGHSLAGFTEHKLFLKNQARFRLLSQAQQVAITKDVKAVAEKLTDRDMKQLRLKRVRLGNALKVKKQAEEWDAKYGTGKLKATETNQDDSVSAPTSTLLDAKLKPSTSLPPNEGNAGKVVDCSPPVATAKPETKQSEEGPDKKEIEQLLSSTSTTTISNKQQLVELKPGPGQTHPPKAVAKENPPASSAPSLKQVKVAKIAGTTAVKDQAAALTKK